MVPWTTISTFKRIQDLNLEVYILREDAYQRLPRWRRRTPPRVRQTQYPGSQRERQLGSHGCQRAASRVSLPNYYMDNGTDDRPCASRRRAHLLKTSAIARWLQASRISPATGASLRNTRLNANYTLRKLIQDHPTRVAEASRTAHMNAQALAEAVEHEARRAHKRARH